MRARFILVVGVFVCMLGNSLVLAEVSTAETDKQWASQNNGAAAAANAARVKKEKEQKAAIAAANQRDAEEWAAAHLLPPDPAATLEVHDGDEIHLRLTQDVSSKTAKIGDPVTMELTDDIRVGDVVVARAGSRAMGEVLWVQKAARMGQPGELQIRMDYLKIGNRKIRLRGSQKKEAGSGSQVGVVAADFFAGPVMIFKHGKEMVMQQGLVIKAYLGDDAMLPPDAGVPAVIPPG